ncbi:hypothetical protein Pint_34180 [Pistacia integerrima]|uniref:Uncharacterized protein n=1 Tax=Pistacia integerrima TaxID=434235 RepID=A0ACC0X770_9ROSI|nr:hypothetical protein Pint_34180 [Pistacia integerrima]
MIPPLSHNPAESHPLTTTSLPTSPADISNTYLAPLVAPQPSFQASARSLASSVPSANLESTTQVSFSAIDDARIFIASLQNMRVCLTTLLRFYQGVHSSQRDKFFSSLMLLMSIDYFTIYMLDTVLSFRMLSEELSSKYSQFVRLMRDIKVATKEKEELRKQLQQKNKCIASLEEQDRILVESPRTSNNALSQYHALEKDKQECDNIINGIDASWDHFRTGIAKLI